MLTFDEPGQQTEAFSLVNSSWQTTAALPFVQHGAETPTKKNLYQIKHVLFLCALLPTCVFITWGPPSSP